jgi:hypothetical protein
MSNLVQHDNLESGFEILKKHDSRCYKCKSTIYGMLQEAYGRIDFKFKAQGVSTEIGAYKNTEIYEPLFKIYSALIGHRNYNEFVKLKTLQRCDLYIPSKGIVVETDEIQHFTYPRFITFKYYPQTLQLGYNMKWYMDTCERVKSADNAPKYRDEQRAWYDVLRDFLPWLHKEVNMTVRIPLGFHNWCSLDPSQSKDVEKFMAIALSAIK